MKDDSMIRHYSVMIRCFAAFFYCKCAETTTLTHCLSKFWDGYLTRRGALSYNVTCDKEVNISHLFETPDSDLSTHFATNIKINLVVCQNSLCFCVKSCIVCEWGSKSVTAVIFSNVSCILAASNFGDSAGYRAIFSHFSLHMCRNGHFWLPVKIWHRFPIFWPQFPYMEQRFVSLRMFSIDVYPHDAMLAL